MPVIDNILLISKADKPTDLVEAYAFALKQQYQLMNAFILQPTENGRYLKVLNHSQPLQWPVAEFDHPFSHVLQNGQTMRLDRAALPYWRANNQFAALLGACGGLQQVRILPLQTDSQPSRVFALLVMLEQARPLDLKQQEFSQITQLFCDRWQELEKHSLQQKNSRALKESLSDYQQKHRSVELNNCVDKWLIGESDIMQKLKLSLVKAAQTELSILLQGQTGCGKELAARAIHHCSKRSDGPFVAINCAAIPEHLLESELFGYEKGAFTGADHNKKGLLAEANGGTLLLDEIGDMPLSLQAKLLRVLENRSFRPVGGKQEQATDFRLITATHVQLRSQVENKGFRADLFYRINQYPIYLPVLCDRKQDIPLLISGFIEKYNENHQRNIRGISFKAVDYLLQYDFPGNVRELRNLIEYACTETLDDQEISRHTVLQRMTMGDFDFANSMAQQAMSTELLHVSELTGCPLDQIDNLKQAVQQYESLIISTRLDKFNGSRAKAAASLGMPKRTLAHKCLKLEIDG